MLIARYSEARQHCATDAHVVMSDCHKQARLVDHVDATTLQVPRILGAIWGLPFSARAETHGYVRNSRNSDL